MATKNMEKPNSNSIRIVRNLPKSIIRLLIKMAQGPNRWWNDKKSRIWNDCCLGCVTRL